MCAHPGCRPAADAFTLKGPAGKPPRSGWALLTLPVGDDIVKSAWNVARKEASGSVDALYQARIFLKHNGITGVDKDLEEHAVDQWCRPDPWRCRGYDPDAVPAAPVLPWARAMWEDCNNRMAFPEDPVQTLKELVLNLTAKINGPDGCPRCAGHWKEYLKTHPLDVHGIDESRHWLWAAHNYTREGKEPVPFEEIAQKFKWLL